MTTIDTLTFANFIMNGGLTFGSPTTLWALLMGTFSVSALGIALAAARPIPPRPRALGLTRPAQAHGGSICAR